MTVASFTGGRSEGERIITQGLTCLQPVALSPQNDNAVVFVDERPATLDPKERNSRLQATMTAFAKQVVVPLITERKPVIKKPLELQIGNRFYGATLIAPSDGKVKDVETLRFKTAPWPEGNNPEFDDDFVTAWVPLEGAEPWIISRPNNLLEERVTRLLCNLSLKVHGGQYVFN